MKEYKLDSQGKGISDSETFLAIKNVIRNTENKNWQNLLLISDLTGNIKTDHLLNPVLELMVKAGLLGEHRESFEKQLLSGCKGKSYTIEDQTKIKAIAFANLIAREVYNKMAPGGTDELLIEIKERKVFTNIDEIEEEVKIKYYTEFKEMNKNLYSGERKDDLKKMLTSLAELKYENNITFFDREIEHFTILKDNLPSGNEFKTVEVTPPHSGIITNIGWKLFQYLLENSITKNRGRKDDIAYYYRRMFNDKYIIARPMRFIEWFSGKPMNEDLGGKLKTLYQVENDIRNKEYSRALEWLKAQ